MSSKYRIPDWIKLQLNREFFDSFKSNFSKQFPSTPLSNRNLLNQTVGTIGLGRAIQDTFKEHEHHESIHYYQMLDWSDSDMFDWELISIMLEKGNSESSRLEREVYAPLMNGLENNDKNSDSFNEACLVAAGIIKRICDFVEDYEELVLGYGSEWLYQTDNAQVGAIGLVGDILDDLEAYREREEIESSEGENDG